MASVHQVVEAGYSDPDSVICRRKVTVTRLQRAALRGKVCRDPSPKRRRMHMRLFQSWFRALPWLIALLLAAALGGCGATEGEGSGAPGTLGVWLTDAPACGFDAVNVTVRGVRVHRSSTASDTDGGWTEITLNPSRKINLLDLTNGVLEALGETPLAPGHYTQLRLMLDPNTGAGFANSVVPTGGVETALATPSAVQSGIKLINEFDVAPGERVDLVLDFDACHSIVRRGNGTFGLKPVIKVTPMVLNGVSGFVDTALLGSNVMVTAQQNGEIIQTTAPRSDGYFLLARLAPGNYDVVFTADGRATAVITGVPVASETDIVEVSISGTPTALPTSAMQEVDGTATLDPASTGTDVSVAARQTFGASPTLTVKSTTADETAGGAYALVLPSGTPQLAAHGALPIVFTPQPGLAGLYAVQASATGYATQSANVNISAADATQNFVLVVP